MSDKKKIIIEELEKNNGILRLHPAWVARDFLPPGRRFALHESQFNLGERGGICERWLASTTKADNRISVQNEGLSILNVNSKEEILLKEAIELLPELILGQGYFKNHKGLGRLAKIFDYEERLPLHIHQMEKHAKLVGRNPKEEAYYFPENVPLGKSPETYFGIHPYIALEKKYDLLLPHLIEWKDDSILQHSRAYKQIHNDGFHVPAGTLHAPGTALTIELQEDSDVFAMMQAKCGNKMIDKELLFKDVRKVDREKYGERIIIEMINWEISGDPYFYENRHTPPILITKTNQAEEYWIFYNTTKFSGKKLVIKPNGKFFTKEKGIYNILIWKGKANYGGLMIEANNYGYDELLITYKTAVEGVEISNIGKEEVIIFKFFGPDINNDVPLLSNYPKK
ncbi:hypothetical protein VJY32_08130 [Ignavibacteria bacterium 4148-Me]|uniref:hypothetical protein n=1 Tax=Rosettibacter primus TaxID=3111523 RepID=UPI00336BFD77